MFLCGNYVLIWMGLARTHPRVRSKPCAGTPPWARNPESAFSLAGQTSPEWRRAALCTSPTWWPCDGHSEWWPSHYMGGKETQQWNAVQMHRKFPGLPLSWETARRMAEAEVHAICPPCDAWMACMPHGHNSPQLQADLFTSPLLFSLILFCLSQSLFR